MNVRLTADAHDDIAAIRTYFVNLDAALAERVMVLIAKVIGTLVIVYRIDLGTRDELIILRVFHLRQSR